jgi:hypothetical protein
MGSFTVENAASGIAKAIDEMDTSEDRQNQVPIFQDTEEEVARMIVETYHPDWMRNAEYKFRGVGFSSGVVVGCKFPEQRPIVDTSKAIDDQKKKIDMGIQDEFGAMKELYPDMTDKEIEEHLQRVQKRKLERMKEAQAAMGENPEGEEQDSGKPPGAAPKGAPGAEADAE